MTTIYRAYDPKQGRWISRDRVGDPTASGGIFPRKVSNELNDINKHTDVERYGTFQISIKTNTLVAGYDQIGSVLFDIGIPHVGRAAANRLRGIDIYSGLYNKYLYSEDDPLNLNDPDGDDWRKIARVCYTLLCRKKFPDPPKPPIREPTCISAPPTPPRD